MDIIGVSNIIPGFGAGSDPFLFSPGIFIVKVVCDMFVLSNSIKVCLVTQLKCLSCYVVWRGGVIQFYPAFVPDDGHLR